MNPSAERCPDDRDTWLVIDPKTSVVLSEKIGRQPVEEKNVTKLYLAVGWTDGPPQVPTVP